MHLALGGAAEKFRPVLIEIFTVVFQKNRGRGVLRKHHTNTLAYAASGPRQYIMYGDFDGCREKSVVVKIIGE